MSQTQVVISKGASGDIAALAAGTERAEVALNALKEEELSPQQKAELQALARRFEETTEQAPMQELDSVAVLILKEGGIFIGRDELVKLGKISADAVVPGIPEKFSIAFLESQHPLRPGAIAKHVILAFDVDSHQWLCIDRGEGGESDVIPDSPNLGGAEQDKLLQRKEAQIQVEGVKISSPRDSNPVERILNNAVALHLKDGQPLESAPFRNIWGRTADTERGAAGCRVLLGPSAQYGPRARDRYRSDDACDLIGLLATWY